MQKFDSLRDIPQKGRGGRVSSPALRQSLDLCNDFSGLEEDTNRYDLLLLVKRAGRAAGFTARMIALLDYYMAFTRDVDWEQGARPIVYQSVSKTALDFGVSERQVQKIEKALFDAGALTWNDSGNHRRFGHRDPETGMIVFAYGVDLTPLAFLKPQLERILQEKKLYDQAWLEAKRQISWHRRQIRAVFSEWEVAQEQGKLAGPYEQHLQVYESIAFVLRTYMTLSDLRALLVKHQELYALLLSYSETDLKPTQFSSKCSATDDQKIVDYNYTIQKQSDKSDINSHKDKSLQKGIAASGKEAGQKGDAAQEQVILSTGLQHITLKQVLNAAGPELRARIPIRPRPLDWADMIEAAYQTRILLGISQKSWAEACLLLGRSGAAICVLLTEQACLKPNNSIHKPAAYFYGMIAKARKKQLRLHASIFGILKREEGAS